MYSISAQAREKLTSAPLWLSIGHFKEFFADYDLKLKNIKIIVEKLYRIPLPICDYTELYIVTGYWISNRITGRISDISTHNRTDTGYKLDIQPERLLTLVSGKVLKIKISGPSLVIAFKFTDIQISWCVECKPV